MKPVGYDFRHAKKRWERRNRPSVSLGDLLHGINNTPGARTRILKQQRQAYLNDRKVISEKELAKFALDKLFNINQWAWDFTLNCLEEEYGTETRKYLESLTKEGGNRNAKKTNSLQP
jgi:hypothetical protein